MAKNKSYVCGVSIEKLENGCIVRVETKTPDKNGYNGYSTTSKSYTADDNLMNEVLKYVKAETDDSEYDEEEEEEESEQPRLLSNPSKF